MDYPELIESVRALSDKINDSEGFPFPGYILSDLGGTEAHKNVLNRLWAIMGPYFKGEEMRPNRLQAVSFLFGRPVASFNELRVSDVYALGQLSHTEDLRSLLEDFANDRPVR